MNFKYLSVTHVTDFSKVNLPPGFMKDLMYFPVKSFEFLSHRNWEVIFEKCGQKKLKDFS
jgi:hypothetical protein